MHAALTTAVLIAVVLASASCGDAAEPAVRSAPAAPAPSTLTATAPREHPRLAPRAARAVEARRLPEDPIAGARSTEASRERRAKGERNRRLVYDRDRMPAHDALIEQIGAARARYDRARNEAALTAARAAMPAQLEKIQASVTKLDPWGTDSGLLADYAALQAALTASYPEAKLATLRGEPSALPKAQADFDQRLHAMRKWLEEAKRAKAKGEGKEDKPQGALEASRR